MESRHAIDALQSLAQETRLAVFRLLVKAGPDGMAAGDISSALSVPGPTLSFHLNQLRNAGLIACRRDGRSLWYSIEFDTVRSLLAFLMEDCCQGHLAERSDAAATCCTTTETDSHGCCS